MTTSEDHYQATPGGECTCGKELVQVDVDGNGNPVWGYVPLHPFGHTDDGQVVTRG